MANWIVYNWPLLVAFASVIAVAFMAVYTFIKEPRDKQLTDVKEWLLWAVTEAERQLGSGTGALKLRYVYNLFLQRFPALAKVITFEMFSGLVDQALEKMKNLLSANKSVKDYVVNDEITHKEAEA